jgi:NADPH2:quinone reductase
MRAIQVYVPGGPEALVEAEIALPEPGPGQVRVRAQAIGVGRPDVLVRSGRYKWMPPLPAVPGAEMSGFIEAVGEGVANDRVGERVLVSARDLPVRAGCYAQAIVVPQEAPYRLPDTLGFIDALSLPNLQLAQALLLGLNGGRMTARHILVTGAAGGVATMLAQLARHLGAHVIGTGRSEDKRSFARAHGCMEVLDPHSPDLVDRVKALTGGSGVDLAFDAIGGTLFIQALKTLAPLGTAVSYNIVSGPPSEDVFQVLRSMLGRSLAVRCFSMHTFDEDTDQRRALMNTAIELMAAGKVHAPQPNRFPLSQVRRAHVLIESGQAMGKIVLEP